MAITRDRLRALFGMEDVRLELLGSRTEDRGSYVIEWLRFASANGEIRGILTRPAQVDGALPAILYSHAHGGHYELGADELLEGHYDAIGKMGPVFAEAGYVTLAIDMPTFGERSWQKESTLTKALLWHGKSLFGQMLSEQASALGYLGSRTDVDASRIGAFGISMGSTLSYWLAAVDKRIAATAHLCCFADFDCMIETGAHDLHGIYLMVPGLLSQTSTGEIAGLVAPRPQLICVGEADALTPPATVDKAFGETKAAYQAAGAGDAVTLLREPGSGHADTPRMRAAYMEFFSRTL